MSSVTVCLFVTDYQHPLSTPEHCMREVGGHHPMGGKPESGQDEPPHRGGRPLVTANSIPACRSSATVAMARGHDPPHHPSREDSLAMGPRRWVLRLRCRRTATMATIAVAASPMAKMAMSWAAWWPVASLPTP